LIRANAWFNLVKIGAVAVGYHPDFYGEVEDGNNAGDRSDRCTIRWELEVPRVVAAIEGRPAGTCHGWYVLTRPEDKEPTA
jgi:predicted GNAT superfamily acetyltransferase